ncbi:unnamed protein product [Penicillium egyptiacum]|uniref:F-box domain-containing protein n=1 Tax=Penicillium egyptiacum TaxID=1303716 RepID=A0A9W4P4Z3_9EURO|nr:unnamed protein product [Penicillium egyptiacum]
MAGSLPLETLQHIFSYQTSRLTPCTCVCRQWQVAAERFTFADLHINSADLDDFRRILPLSNSAGRRFHLRSLYFKIILPEYSVAARGHYETQDDRDGNNKVFTQAITSLFEILSSWPKYDCYMSLQIYARSPSDWQAEPDWTIRRTRQERGYAFPEEELLQRRYQDSYLQLMGKTGLPDVKCITSLDVSGCENFRNIAPGAVSKITVHLPRLQTITARLCDKVRNDTEMCDGLGDFPTVAASWPSSLRHLQLRYEPRYDEDYIPHSTPGPNFRSLALHQMTQQLESVDLSETMIGPELFWPVDANNTTPFWPNLIQITIRYSNAPASWDDSVEPPDDQQESPFKSKYLDELSLAAGRAAQHMPRLNSMEIGIGSSSTPASHYYFTYDAILGEAIWAISSEFYVSKKAQQAWDVAAKRHGTAMPSVVVCAMDTHSSNSSLSA